MVIKDMGIKQIEGAITQLSAKELVELVSWLEEYHAQVWDKRIDDDLEAGRLNALLAEVENEYSPRKSLVKVTSAG